MTGELLILTLTAASIGFIHTLLGPDHYLPFIAMARAGKWSLLKTGCITLVCGIGHILSSVALGIIGIALGVAVTKLEQVESFRGGLAAWALIAFGLVYFVWGARKALKDRVHPGKEPQITNLTPWILFTIFILGPCEPLIPILMYPAAKGTLFGLVLVTAVFGAVTIATMLGIVLISCLGVSLVGVGKLERYMHALAGATICLCGIAIQLLGL